MASSREDVTPEVLQEAEAEVFPDGSGIRIKDWTIKAHKEHILGDKALHELSDRLSHPPKLPEILFGGSYLSLVHEPTETSFQFRAAEALQGWREENLPPVQVPAAQEWQHHREQEIAAQHPVRMKYDWTFTTPYNGTAVRSGNADSAAGPAVAFAPTEAQIDRRMLMERDPILFYADVPLYESELDDSGVCSLSVKVRVMPKCWFVLLRFFLRVDGVLIRLRETRLFCKLEGPAVVTREMKWHEGTNGELKKLGAPVRAEAYANGDAAAQSFSAIAPNGVTRFTLESVRL
ncbi:unnamed protein product [Pedinophyceae sp. YPF-701]|nr:unnamed protein product [Pedinophyceae sp. YPF-701]